MVDDSEADMVVRSWFQIAKGKGRTMGPFKMMRMMKKTMALCLLLNAVDVIALSALYHPEASMGLETTPLSWTLRNYAACFAIISAFLTVLPLCPPFAVPEGVAARICGFHSKRVFVRMGMLYALGSASHLPDGKILKRPYLTTFLWTLFLMLFNGSAERKVEAPRQKALMLSLTTASRQAVTLIATSLLMACVAMGLGDPCTVFVGDPTLNPFTPADYLTAHVLALNIHAVAGLLFTFQLYLSDRHIRALIGVLFPGFVLFASTVIISHYHPKGYTLSPPYLRGTFSSTLLFAIYTWTAMSADDRIYIDKEVERAASRPLTRSEDVRQQNEAAAKANNLSDDDNEQEHGNLVSQKRGRKVTVSPLGLRSREARQDAF